MTEESFKVIVAGGRYFTDYQLAVGKLNSILSGKVNIQIVSGCCDTGMKTFVRDDGRMICGADGIGERYAKVKKLPVKYFPADWTAHGKAAGPIRNREMAMYGNAAVIFWDGESKGSKSMIDLAQEYGLPTRVILYEPKNKKK